MVLNCCLIGEDSLLIQCGNILLSKNHAIVAVISNTSAIQDWAKKEGLLCLSHPSELFSQKISGFDYLFSIVNSHILTHEIIKLAKQAAINYHDSPLPKYAGLNSTTWAIINEEVHHGVTWHQITSKIDEGDIVKQSIFPIYADDTAFTLNLRAYEHAITTFELLIADIEKNSLTFKQQDLSQRSYFGIDCMLPNFGFINWQEDSAEKIERINRALTFDHYNNHVGTLKLNLNTSYLTIGMIEILHDSLQDNSPGEILAIDENNMVVATTSTPIKISRFITSEGKSIIPSELTKTQKLAAGIILPPLNFSDKSDFVTIYQHALKYEQFWIQQFKRSSENGTFISSSINKGSSLQQIDSIIKLPVADDEKKKSIFLTAVLVYLYRLNNYEVPSVQILHKNHITFNHWARFFSSILPITADFKPTDCLEQALMQTQNQLELIYSIDTYLTDISARHPGLVGSLLERQGVLINFMGTIPKDELLKDILIYFKYNEANNEIVVYHRINAAYHQGMLVPLLENMAGHLKLIMDEMLTTPSTTICALNFISTREKNTLLNQFGQGTFLKLPQKTIPDLFETQVLQNPNHPCIYIGEKVITNQELWELSERVAINLQSLNLPSQSFIGIYIHRSIEMLAVILGILKVNCVFVPLDTRYPVLKIEMIIENANLSLIVTSDELVKNIETLFNDTRSIKLLSIKNALSENKKNSIFLPKYNEFSDKKLGYVMFTSGTTGMPKGVLVTQRNIINYCLWFGHTTNFNKDSIIDFSSSIAFDLSIPCTLAPLVLGGSIAICDEATKLNTQRYLLHLIYHKVTHTELTPGYLEQLLEHYDLMKGLVDLKVLLLGADVVLASDVIKALSICPHLQVVNEYGPTETTVSCTSYFVNREKIPEDHSIPIGKPGFNTQAYVVDNHQNLCPIGVKGELLIGGNQVTMGYLNRPEATNAKFVVNKFQKSEQHIYKTGDIACWLPDGSLQFFGRNDHQVKIQGYRIELSGIEAALLKIPEIHQAAVIVMQGHFKEKHLRAYLVVEMRYPSLQEIKSFLATLLPIYMIPKEFCLVENIPLKENEKIDRDVLEKQPHTFLSFDHAFSTDVTDIERTMMRIWEHAFNNPEITITDDFFDIGGDSLTALAIVTDLRKYYQIDIALYSLFEHPTIEKFSQKIEKMLYESKQSHIKLVAPPQSIIKLSDSNSDKPIFLIHPVGGTVFWYKLLAKYLGEEFTIYAIQDPSIDGHNGRFGSLELMAESYLRDIEAVYNGSAYYLGGASYGGTVAYEMANQLINANKKVQFLGLFDGWAKYPIELLNQNTINLLTQIEGDQVISHDEKHYLSELEEYRKQLLINYQIPNVHINMDLFKANELWESFDKKNDAFNHWKDYVKGNIKVHMVPGNHETMFFEPAIKTLAEKMKLSLRRATV